MSEWEDRLNSILSSPEQMGRIVELANQLSGEAAGSGHGEARDAPSSFPPPSPSGAEAKLMQLAGKVLGAGSAEDRNKAELIRALKPFLQEEHCRRLDRAYEISRMIRTVRLVYREMKGDGGLV